MIETERLHRRKPTADDAGRASHLEQWQRLGVGTEHRGRACAAEAAPAAREWARRDRGIDRIVSLIARDNLPSQRVAERLGAAPTETVILPDSTEAVVWLHP